MFCLLAVKRSGEDVNINDQKFLHMYICAYNYCDIRLQSPSLTVAVIMKCTVRLEESPVLSQLFFAAHFAMVRRCTGIWGYLDYCKL